MRVLAIGNMYPPHHLGGYELAWASSVRHQRAAGHAVRVLTTDHREAEPQGPEEPDVHRELRWYWRDHRIPRKSWRKRIALERDSAATLERHLAEFRPEVIAWWAMGGMPLSLVERVRRAGIPAGFVVCDDWLLYAVKLDRWMRHLAARPRTGALAERITGIPGTLDLEAAGRWVFLSETLRRRARERGWRLEKSVVCGRGADRERFPASPPQRWRWRMLVAGRIDSRKGINLAIAALPHLPAEATLEVNGSGDPGHLRELEALARDEGVESRVEFRRDPQRGLADRYAGADVVLFPVRWDEPWGLVPLEAMSVGRPVIASGRGGSGEYLEHEVNCLIADPNHGSRALAGAIHRLAREPDLRERLRAAGFRTTDSITVEAFNETVLDALRDAAEGR